MIKSVNNYPISQLFDPDSKVVYAVPRYQREYTWGKGQWEKLFDDILENQLGYFLGSIICINQSTDTLLIQELELVDGQQRLTTLSLLFAAIYQALKTHENELDDSHKADMVNLKRKLVLKSDTDRIRVVPQIQNNNQADYRAVLAEVGIISADTPLYAGNRNIFRAFRYFQKRIKGLYDNQASQLESIMTLLEKVSMASLVKIEVISHADAYILFESLNNRGIPLTAIDLIKNKLLARLESIEPGRVDHYYDNWKGLLKYIGDDYGTQERFFRQYYNAFKERLKTIYQVPLAKRSNLIQIYERLINNDAKGCLQSLLDAARLYAVLLNRSQDQAFEGLEKSLKDLNRIQGAPSYLLMLYLLAHRGQLRLEIHHLDAVIRLLVRFFVRRNLTDIPPTRDLTKIFMSIVDGLSGKTGDSVIDVVLRKLSSVSASDQVFREKLDGPLYKENSGVTRFILYGLAEQGMTRESWVDLWRLENRQYVWTIEHIFPQGENIPPSWVKMMAGGDEQLAKKYQETHVHKLGNLTISGFNSTLGNKSFAEKRDRTDQQGRYVGYKNGLKLNEDLAVAQGWSIDQIDARTRKLVDQAMMLFSIDGGNNESE